MIVSSILCEEIEILSTRHLKDCFSKRRSTRPSKRSTRRDGYYEVHNMDMDNTVHITCGGAYTTTESTL